ncbi:uncharacterized protein OCT59_018454 [Rhizophagus irregularis]|nr:hypothetical protein OCT59_018454 [Rhizophagus irregularis]CAG8641018.1 19683_t:CDS:2 [Rhizophagus irregularis]
MSAQPAGRDPYYGDRRASPAPQHYHDQAYSDYGPPMQSKSPDLLVDRMNSLRIGDNQQYALPPRSNSTPVTSNNLLHASPPQRAISQKSSRPRPNQERIPPQYEPQQDEYQTYNYQDGYYDYPQGSRPPLNQDNQIPPQDPYYNSNHYENRDYYPPRQHYDPAMRYPEDQAYAYPQKQYGYDQGAYDYQGYNYDPYQPEGDGYYNGPPQYYYDSNYNPNYDPNYPPQGYPQEGYPQEGYPVDEFGQPIHYDQSNRTYSDSASNISSATKQKDPAKAEEKPSYAPEAIEKYRQKAKDSGDPATLFKFGNYLIEAAGATDEQDPKSAKKKKDALLQEAVKIIKRLATQGIGFGRPAYPDAQFYLANCYGNGSLGLPMDPDKAFNLYMQASKQNHATATYRTAVCYEYGAGTKRDPNRATQFYKKAAALGDTAAMYKLGIIMLRGLLNQNPNPRDAVIWLKRAAANADEENPHALHELGLLHAKPEKEPPEIPSLIRSEKHAIEEFKKAADLGYAPSCFKLGCCYEYGQLGCPVDPRQSIRYYSRAAEKGHSEAELALSGWYLTGSNGILNQSDTEAYLWARKAADKGLAKAEYAIGYFTEVGIGVKADIEEARRWYMRAAAQGNKRAMQRLKELNFGHAGRAKPAKYTRAQANKEDCTIS